jgi:hypothetical protein
VGTFLGWLCLLWSMNMADYLDDDDSDDKLWFFLIYMF